MVASLLLVVLLSACPATSAVKPDQRQFPSYSMEPEKLLKDRSRVERPLGGETADRAIRAVKTGNDVVDMVQPPQPQCSADATDGEVPKAIPVGLPREIFSGAGNSSVDEERLIEFVDQAFREDLGCQKVYTGNRGLFHEVNDREIGYPRSLARAFAEDVCSPIDLEIQKVVNAAPVDSKMDALARPAFKQYLAVSAQNDDLVNAAATYSMLYSHGLRESDGNFQLGRDEAARNSTPLTEEAGAFQVASNTLDGAGAGVRARRRVMEHYLDRLADAQSRGDVAAMSSICGIREAAELPPGNRGKVQNEEWLTSSFDAGAGCGLLREKLRTHGDALSRASRERGVCFMELQKRCPLFAMRYNAVAIRTRADHFGPLKIRKLNTSSTGPGSKSEVELESEARESGKIWDGYRNVGNGKKPPRPQCRGIFQVILDNKDLVCGPPRPGAETSGH
jgi:hypothetical protein